MVNGCIAKVRSLVLAISKLVALLNHPDVHKGTYSIFSTNLTTKRTTPLVDAFPGGATRPELSHDGRTLAFVRRVRDKEALVLKFVNHP